jgi:hypothetical protein
VNFETTLFLACSNAFFLIVWFDTNAFYEYFKVLRLHKVKTLDDVFGISEYEKFLSDNKIDILYWEYTAIVNQGFSGKLITCPICISFWFHLVVFVIYPTIAPVSLIWTLFLYNAYAFLRKHG